MMITEKVFVTVEVQIEYDSDSREGRKIAIAKAKNLHVHTTGSSMASGHWGARSLRAYINRDKIAS